MAVSLDSVFIAVGRTRHRQRGGGGGRCGDGKGCTLHGTASFVFAAEDVSVRWCLW